MRSHSDLGGEFVACGYHKSSQERQGRPHTHGWEKERSKADQNRHGQFERRIRSEESQKRPHPCCPIAQEHRDSERQNADECFHTRIRTKRVCCSVRETPLVCTIPLGLGINLQV